MAHFWKSRSDVDSIFGLITDLKTSVLPRNSDIIKCLLFVQKKNSDSALDAYKQVSDKIIKLWQTKLCIPLAEEKNIISKIKRLHNAYLNVKKFNSGQQKKFEEENKLKLFDISKCKCKIKCSCEVQMSQMISRFWLINGQANQRHFPIKKTTITAAAKTKTTTKPALQHRCRKV